MLALLPGGPSGQHAVELQVELAIAMEIKGGAQWALVTLSSSIGTMIPEGCDGDE